VCSSPSVCVCVCLCVCVCVCVCVFTNFCSPGQALTLNARGRIEITDACTNCLYLINVVSLDHSLYTITASTNEVARVLETDEIVSSSVAVQEYTYFRFFLPNDFDGSALTVSVAALSVSERNNTHTRTHTQVGSALTVSVAALSVSERTQHTHTHTPLHAHPYTVTHTYIYTHIYTHTRRRKKREK